MRPGLESLRGRLVVAMMIAFAFGLGGTLALNPLEKHGAVLSRLGMELIREPYQDASVLLAFSLLASALIWLVSGWSLRHLAAASREAAIVGPANPGARISTEKLPGEVRPLVDTVNGALDRLSEAYAAEQRFVADAAHELRTPLAVLNLRLQLARLDGAPDWPAIEQDLMQVNRLASQLLDLARKEHARQVDPAVGNLVANLSRLAREAAAAVVPLAEKAGRALEIELPDPLLVRGRPDDLRDMLRNLLDNALTHGRGTVRVDGQVEISSGGRRQACITVSDEGPGVSAELTEAVFDRFRKGSPESSGHGLGLAIVRAVAHGHDGSVAIQPGSGCRVRIMLPIAERGK